MAFFDNLFGKKAKPPPFKPDLIAAPVPPPRNPPRSNEMIKAFDAYGREIQITREEWRTGLEAFRHPELVRAAAE